MDLVALIIVCWLVAHAWDRTKQGWRQERDHHANQISAANPTWGTRQVRRAANRRAALWWGHEIAAGFPSARNSLAEDWGHIQRMRSEDALAGERRRDVLRKELEDRRRKQADYRQAVESGGTTLPYHQWIDAGCPGVPSTPGTGTGTGTGSPNHPASTAPTNTGGGPTNTGGGPTTTGSGPSTTTAPTHNGGGPSTTTAPTHNGGGPSSTTAPTNTSTGGGATNTTAPTTTDTDTTGQAPERHLRLVDQDPDSTADPQAAASATAQPAPASAGVGGTAAPATANGTAPAAANGTAPAAANGTAPTSPASTSPTTADPTRASGSPAPTTTDGGSAVPVNMEIRNIDQAREAAGRQAEEVRGAAANSEAYLNGLVAGDMNNDRELMAEFAGAQEATSQAATQWAAVVTALNAHGQGEEYAKSGHAGNMDFLGRNS
jgi:hypothetical protein